MPLMFGEAKKRLSKRMETFVERATTRNYT